jgi:phytoene/squalene synthetase
LADQLRLRDPLRFDAVMAAPVAARPPLMVLYAFNLEVARAPWASEQPLICEMRLQWWLDAVEDAAKAVVRKHEVMEPLAELIAKGLPVGVLEKLIQARQWDIYKDPFADEAAFDSYLEDTGAGLMWLAAKALGAPDRAEAAVRGYGWASALASYFQAVPALAERGRIPLLDGRDSAVSALAGRGLARLHAAQRQKTTIPAAARPALLAGWQARRLLQMAGREPGRVGEGHLDLSEFARRGGLLWASFTGGI